jgi:hypothetical protein
MIGSLSGGKVTEYFYKKYIIVPGILTQNRFLIMYRKPAGKFTDRIKYRSGRIIIVRMDNEGSSCLPSYIFCCCRFRIDFHVPWSVQLWYYQTAFEC